MVHIIRDSEDESPEEIKILYKSIDITVNSINLTLYQTIKFRNGPIESVSRQQINVIQKSNVLWGSIENIAGKRENAGYKHFLLFPQCFQKVLS